MRGCGVDGWRRSSVKADDWLSGCPRAARKRWSAEFFRRLASGTYPAMILPAGRRARMESLPGLPSGIGANLRDAGVLSSKSAPTPSPAPAAAGAGKPNKGVSAGGFAARGHPLTKKAPPSPPLVRWGWGPGFRRVARAQGPPSDLIVPNPQARQLPKLAPMPAPGRSRPLRGCHATPFSEPAGTLPRAGVASRIASASTISHGSASGCTASTRPSTAAPCRSSRQRGAFFRLGT